MNKLKNKDQINDAKHYEILIKSVTTGDFVDQIRVTNPSYVLIAYIRSYVLTSRMMSYEDNYHIFSYPVINRREKRKEIILGNCVRRKTM